MNLLRIILIITLAGIVTACDDTDNLPQQSENNYFANLQGDAFLPLTIAFLDDVSGSRDKFNIPALEIDALEPAIKYVKKNGGAVLLGVVSANSDKTTVQFQVDPNGAPVRPGKPVSADYSNRFEFHDAKENYNEVKLPQYRQDSTRYAKSLSSKVQEFKVRAKDLMSSEHDPEATDIASAINRAIYFHQLGPKHAHRATVIISDGVDNQGSKVLTNQNMDISYYLAYGSTKNLGSWADICKPVITPDLKFALNKILTKP